MLSVVINKIRINQDLNNAIMFLGGETKSSFLTMPMAVAATSRRQILGIYYTHE